MKKIVPAILFASVVSFASEYYAKVEPIDTFSIKSDISGKVLFTNDSIEGKTIEDGIVVKIDSKIDKIDLNQTLKKLQNYKNILAIEKDTLKSFQKVSSKSKFDKDLQKIKILNVESTISDLTTKIATLRDRIAKKELKEKNSYIYNIAVKKGDYVNPGSLLYQSMDLSSGKLEIYIPISSKDEILSQSIYIDGKKTDLKISKLYDVADSKHLSSYKCEIVIPSPKQFSKLVKIEFK